MTVIALTWGSSFILIKKSLVVFTPYEIGAVRVGVAGLLMSAAGIPALLKMPKRTLFWVVVAGFFGNFFPLYLFPMAQTQVSSSLAGMPDSLVPVFVLAFGFLFFGERSRLSQIAGAVIGLLGAGSLIYFSESGGQGSQIGYALLIVLAAMSYGINALLIKEKVSGLSSIKLTAAVFTVWMIPSFVILYFTGFVQRFEATPEAVEALGYLGFLTVFGTAIAMLLYYKLIQNTTPVFASTVSYLLPIIAVLWGVADGEQFTIWYVVSGLMILAGIYLIQDEKPDNRPPKSYRPVGSRTVKTA